MDENIKRLVEWSAKWLGYTSLLPGGARSHVGVGERLQFVNVLGQPAQDAGAQASAPLGHGSIRAVVLSCLCVYAGLHELFDGTE